MALRVNGNDASNRAITQVHRTQRSLTRSFSRISSGLRIASAADDAAGLAVSENLDSRHRSLRQAARNTNDGIAMLQTAEGATSEVAEMLKRMRELAVQSASGTITDTERGYADVEYQALKAEIDRVADTTEYNGVKLGNSGTTFKIQVGIDATNSQIDLVTSNLKGLGTGSVTSASNATSAITALDTRIQSVSSYRSKYGAVHNRLESALNNLETYSANVAGAASTIRDADFAHETAELSKFQIMQQAGVAILGQANGLNTGALRLIG